MGFPQTDFGSLVQALYGIEEGIARGLWADSSSPDSKGKKLGSGPRSLDIGAIGTFSHRFHVSHRLIDSLQIFLTRWYNRISIDQLLAIGRQGLLIYIHHYSQYMLHKYLRGHLYNTISSIEHRLHRGRLGSLHSSGCH